MGYYDTGIWSLRAVITEYITLFSSKADISATLMLTMHSTAYGELWGEVKPFRLSPCINIYQFIFGAMGVLVAVYVNCSQVYH